MRCNSGGHEDLLAMRCHSSGHEDLLVDEVLPEESEGASEGGDFGNLQNPVSQELHPPLLDIPSDADSDVYRVSNTRVRHLCDTFEEKR